MMTKRNRERKMLRQKGSMMNTMRMVRNFLPFFKCKEIPTFTSNYGQSESQAKNVRHMLIRFCF